MTKLKQNNTEDNHDSIQQATAYLLHCVNLLETAIAQQPISAQHTEKLILAQALKKSEEARAKLEAANNEVAKKLIGTMELLRDILESQE
ncbi:hypothetical protein [Bartonella sp. TP]|uniref:hypothetical protein n=1 Tax=Bartonella sp. TP TaxID=3057550 RepID=UPI0025B2760F|nr:hypothetical protein [Bartonella sp. TP]WJW79584.1 hypothetical protein QVL57_03425 [Bartonella sp. TP]